jgi:hypothetical protein
MRYTDWAMEIIRVPNGYKVGNPRYLSGEGHVWEEEVIQDCGEDVGPGIDEKSSEELLWKVMKHFHLGGSKHDAKRLRVVWETRDGDILFMDSVYRVVREEESK